MGNFRFKECTFDFSELCVNHISGGTAFKENDLAVDFANALALGRHGFDLNIFDDITFSHVLPT